MIGVIIITILIVFIVIQHFRHQHILNDKRYEHNMSVNVIHDAVSSAWVCGTLESPAYHKLIKVVEDQEDMV